MSIRRFCFWDSVDKKSLVLTVKAPIAKGLASAEFDLQRVSFKQAEIAHQIQTNEVYIFADTQTFKNKAIKQCLVVF